MLFIIGDLHGEWQFFSLFEEQLEKDGRLDAPISIIQVGDFGFYPEYMDYWKGCKWPVYAIDGNHEHFGYLKQFKDVSEVRQNLFYVPRGKVLELEGYRIGFIGGAESVDVKWREEGISWFPEERVLEIEADRIRNEKLDILISHAPPSSVISRNFAPLNKLSWGLPADWEDVSSKVIEKLWCDLGRIPMFCGHMHRSILDGNCRILNVDELYALPENDPNRQLKLWKNKAQLV